MTRTLQKRIEERRYTTSNRVRTPGKSSVIADCPFCAGPVVIFLWSIAGNGKKRCPCGAALHADGLARKLVKDAP
jgi:hypothetical protein